MKAGEGFSGVILEKGTDFAAAVVMEMEVWGWVCCGLRLLLLLELLFGL